MSKLENVDVDRDCESRPGNCGRPRSEASRLALLEAAYGLMAEHPVSSISSQQIANQAGVSTATVYRWWPSKEALLLDAFLAHKEKVETEDGATPLQRLRAHVLKFSKGVEGKQGKVTARMLTAIQDDEKLREAFAQQAYLPQCGHIRTLAERAIEAGEIPEGTDLDLLLDMIFGIVVSRLLLQHVTTRTADVAKAFDMAIAGARASAPSRTAS